VRVAGSTLHCPLQYRYGAAGLSDQSSGDRPIRSETRLPGRSFSLPQSPHSAVGAS
jgi:hypothetical protein